MGKLRRLMTGYDDKETAEQRVRRLDNNRFNGYIQPVIPALVDLYDRIAELEARVEKLSKRCDRPERKASVARHHRVGS